jgi:type IV fimbrial biogenesis protein FimT
MEKTALWNPQSGGTSACSVFRNTDISQFHTLHRPQTATKRRKVAWSVSIRQDKFVNKCSTFLKHGLLRNSRGFTLIELMVTLAVMALLMLVAVPSFQSTIASSRVTTVTNDLVGALASARTEAIRRGVRVTVCASADGASCLTGSDWSQGWVVFTDINRNAAIDTDSDPNTVDDVVLATSPATPAGIGVKGDASAERFVSYAPDGQPKTATGAVWSGNLQICSDSSQLGDARRARLLDINTTGRVHTSTPTGISSACAAPT